jgi:uncharacterized iron-regulated protein
MPAIPVLFLLMALSAADSAFASPGPPPTVYRLDVAFDIARSAVSGTVTVYLGEKEGLSLLTGRLDVRGVRRNGREVAAAVRDGVLSVLPGEAGILEVRYDGVFRASESSGDRNYGVVGSTIDARGISLTGLWHPRPEGPAVWKLTAMLPPEYEAVSEAETLHREPKGNGTLFSFDFPHPVEGLTLVASDRYEVTRDRHGAVELYAYFFREDRELARGYLRSVKKYLELYEKMLTPYPFRQFSVVENFLPSGYSMPTFTLLGQDVVRLPFITETSLGHEVLHQWFGCSVYTDDARGNWAEGLTTYLADHWYEEQKGKGWEYRKQLLVNYVAYVNEDNDIPLREFRSRTDFASRAIGYGKAALVFHMLRNQVGDEQFFASLRDVIATRQFRPSSWDDLQQAFERKTGTDLGAFFKEWVGGTGLPEVAVESASVRRKGDRFEISLGLKRGGSTLPLTLPVTVSFLRGGTKRETIVLDADRKTAALLVDDEPAEAVIDADYDVARIPVPDEVPPVIARLVGDEEPLIVLPEKDRDRYAAVISDLAERGGVEREAADLKDEEVRTSSLAILGNDNPAIRRLFARADAPAGGFSIDLRKNPWNPDGVAAVIHAASAAETEAAFGKIFHYGKYSSLAFEKGRNVGKTIAPSERGIIVLLREEPAVIDLSMLRGFPAVVEGAADKRIIYIGEYHDRFSNHTIQLQLLKALHAKDRSLAVGMEMFQRPFQATLDEYIAGAISEREFLSRSEYFKRWGFDYNLYKPILDFCRAEKVPVIALNIRREIVDKVSKGGMDSLTEEERKDLPREMDFSNEAYRQRLRQAFAQHRDPGKRNFDFFLQSQVLWDETMAETVSDYLARNPGRRMAVIAGGGHLVYGEGIPKRAHRRNGLTYTIVLNDGDLDPGIADYLIFPAPLDGMTAPKLLATFKEADQRLVINDFVNESPAKAAGLRTGDAVIAIDGAPVSTVQDVKLILHYKSKGDTLLMTVARKRFLLGEKVMTVEVKL